MRMTITKTIGLFLKRFAMVGLLCLVAGCLASPGCSDKKSSKATPSDTPPPIPREEQPPATQPASGQK